MAVTVENPPGLILHTSYEAFQADAYLSSSSMKRLEIFLIASCYLKRDKRRPERPRSSYAELTREGFLP